MTNTNLDEHLAEHLAEKAAKEAAEKAKKDAEHEAQTAKWREERIAEQKARLDRDNMYLERIADAVTSLAKTTGSTRTVVHDRERGRLSIADIDVMRQIHIVEDQKRKPSSYRYGRTRTEGKGTFSIKIGNDYRRGNAVRFKAKSDGTHDYATMATMLMHHVGTVLELRRMENQEEQNEVVAQALRTEFNLSEYDSGVTASSDATKPVHIDLSRIYQRSANMTADQAKALLLDLQAHGFRLNYERKV